MDIATKATSFPTMIHKSGISVIALGVSSLRRTAASSRAPYVMRMPIRPRSIPSNCSWIALALQVERIRYFTTNNTAAEEHKVCWKCDHIVPQVDMHCCNDDCGAIQNVPKDINFFETLQAGLGENASEPIYDVDVRKLRLIFLRKQQQVHPDSYAQKSTEEYQLAQNQSSFLNKAYNTLKDPLTRAHYMLALNGVEVSESESLEDPELLMEVMEVREQMEECETEEDIEKLRLDNEEKIEQTASHLTKAFQSKDLEEAKSLAVQLQYWDNIRRAIVDWAPGKRIELQH